MGDLMVAALGATHAISCRIDRKYHDEKEAAHRVDDVGKAMTRGFRE